MNNKIIKEFKEDINIDAIEAIMKVNNGYVTSKQVTELGIHRMYLNIMLKQNKIERVKKGIYIDINMIEDIYYTFQLKYPKTIFSGMTALYFHGLTEVYPNNFDVTVSNNYHVDTINKSHLVTKCKDEYINIGKTKVKTPFNNEVYAYDPERCICDLIKYKKKFDLEQIKKSVKMYVNSTNSNLNTLSIYAKKMNIYNEVIDFVGMFYE